MREGFRLRRRRWRFWPRSLQWQLQAWQAFLSTCMLAAFGIAVYDIGAARRFNQVDAELQTRVGALRRAITEARHLAKPADRDHYPRNASPIRPFRASGAPRSPWRPKRPPPELLGPPPGPPPSSEHLLQDLMAIPAETSALFGPETGFYFAIWARNSTVVQHSQNAPAGSPKPTAFERDSFPHFRTWDSQREVIHCSGVGDCVLVGRSIADELRNAKAIAWLIPAAGAAALLTGLIGGWLIISRAVQPVKLIEATAEEIRRGKLSARVPVRNPDNELGRLSSTLNATFARLETAFERQKQFTADAAHELRTPLAIMISEAQTSLARPRSAAEYKEAVENCHHTAQEMRKLTETLLDLAHIEVYNDHANAQRAEMDLADVVLDCIQRLQPLGSSQAITLRREVCPARMVNVAERMAAIVMNLLLNAIIYNRPGGEVLIRTWNDGGYAVLSVADTGIGIAPADLPRIFDRFYRTDKVRSRVGGHAGLGLSICKAILDAECGTIQVESEIGKGSVFTVHLPARV